MAIYTGNSKQLGGTEKKVFREQYYYGLVQKNVLITGAEGQLGCELREQEERSNNLFCFIYTNHQSLDITDRQQVFDFVRRYKISYIINCAAYTDVEKAEREPDIAFAVNCRGVENLAVASLEYQCRFVHISTDFVFDGRNCRLQKGNNVSNSDSRLPYREIDLPNPLSVYGKSKLFGERTLQHINPEAIIVRTSWLYSSYGKNFVKTMLHLMRKGGDLRVVSDQIGSPTYAADLAEMIIYILEYSENKVWKPGIYHFANIGRTSWYDFANEIKRIGGFEHAVIKPVTTVQYGAVAPRPAFSALDCSKICDSFNVKIPDWKNALARAIKKINNI